MEPVKVLAATGMLGTGFAETSFWKALKKKPDVIGCDAGSTDPGPYYLGSDTPMVSREATKRDLKIMIKGAVANEIPLLIGSAGTAGTNSLVDWTADIVREIAKEEAVNLKIASIYSELEKDKVMEYFRKGKMSPLQNAPQLNEDSIGKLSKVVGQMGPEPYIEALEQGAQVVIAGRSSDTSIFAAVPIKNGLNSGAVWHASKILECGAGCVENRIHPDCMFSWIYPDHFVIEPPNEKMKCTPVSVLSHFLYENADPYHLFESSGMLDTEKALYHQLDERSVKVSDSEFHHSEQQTIRLEGIEEAGFRRVCMGGIRDPYVLRQLPAFLEEASSVVKKKVLESLGAEEKNYELIFRVYGQTGVMGVNEPEKEFGSHEAGILIEVVSDTYELAQAVMSIAWHTILHHPIKEWAGLVSHLAFPFSPPDMDMGKVYRFALNHTVEIEDPLELFTITVENLENERKEELNGIGRND